MTLTRQIVEVASATLAMFDAVGEPKPVLVVEIPSKKQARNTTDPGSLMVGVACILRSNSLRFQKDPLRKKAVGPWS